MAIIKAYPIPSENDMNERKQRLDDYVEELWSNMTTTSDPSLYVLKVDYEPPSDLSHSKGGICDGYGLLEGCLSVL